MKLRRSYIRFVAWFLAGWAVSATAAEPQYLVSIAVSQSGVIYLADRDLPGIWKLEGEKLSVFFAGSKTFRTPLNAIRCVAFDGDGKLVAGDTSTRDIYRFDETGKPVGLTQTAAAATVPPEKGSGKSTTPPRPMAVLGQIGIPMDIAVDKSGDFFVSDLEFPQRIVKVAKAGGPAHEFVKIHAPRGICMDAEENLWVVSGRKLVRVSPAGEKTTVVDDGVFNYPHTVAVGADKTAYVCDGYEKCIWKVPSGGKPEKLVSGEPLVNPVGMRLVADKLYVVDPRAKAVFQITFDGKITTLPMKQ